MKKLNKSKKGKGRQAAAAAPPSKHISANEVRYMSQAQKKPMKVRESVKEYDKQLATSRNKLLLNLRVLSGVSIFLLVFNIASPLYLSGAMAFKSFFQKVICVIQVYNIFSAWGWFNHKVALAWWFFARFTELTFYVVIRPGTINWTCYWILVILDILFLMIFVYDTRFYEEVDRPME